MNRLLAILAALLLSASAFAATVADRSPFAQGHWWDSTRAGSGFEFFNVADQAMVIWYTYEESGRPVWYTAQGSVATMATQQWPLLKHRWENGRKGEATEVGWMRVSVSSSESATVAWNIRGTQGTNSIQPFIVSGVVNEVDHTGSYFDPANSGWGFTLTEQGDVLGGVLFAYDASGAPTWAAGFGRERGSVALSTFEGACPSCAWRASTPRDAGRLGLEFREEWKTVLRNNLTFAMAPGVNVDGSTVLQLSRPASSRPADRQLASFDQSAALKAYLDEGMLNVKGSFAGADFSPAPPSASSTPAFSGTNLQEKDVDEADLVKTDGRLVYTFEHRINYLLPQPKIRVAIVGQDGWTLGMRGSVTLAGEWTPYVSKAGLFLHGDKLVSVSSTGASTGWAVSAGWTRGTFQVEVMNRATPDDLPATLWRAEIEGTMVATRRIGDRLYVISRFVPYIQGFSYGVRSEPYLSRNRDLLAWARLEDLLPKMRVNGADAVTAMNASTMFAPPQGSRTPLADMIMVTVIDVASPRVLQTLGIIGTIETVYASTGNLYLASSRSEYRGPNAIVLALEPPALRTDIHQIRLGTDVMSIVASGTVEGYLGPDADKSAFRLSEHEGKLRAVSSSNTWWGSNKNRLTILEPSATAPGVLRTVSILPNAARPEPLGKPNELLFGTRFVADRLYAVTFKNIDPLYVIDMADSRDPRIAGALELPGFSDYLHPLANGLLLGFGKDAVPADTTGDAQFAWYQGLQLSLFDVSDAARPREIQRALMGKRGSESALMRSHHAFSVLPAADGSLAIALPARIHDGAHTCCGASAYYQWQYSGLLRYEVRGSTPADARLQALPFLVTHRSLPGNESFQPDDASAVNARSVLFRNGTVYVSSGKFWHLDNVGTIVGPY
ncbi:MAG: beta-propeller domain-containing protein [Usitatibacter sp.]